VREGNYASKRYELAEDDSEIHRDNPVLKKVRFCFLQVIMQRTAAARTRMAKGSKTRILENTATRMPAGAAIGGTPAGV
jgi:hypothetical protein